MALIDTLKALHAAEDFFTLLDVPFDPAVLGRARLHILKRMGQGLGQAGLAELPDEAARARARALLTTAYDEFVASPAIDKRLFKVLAERDPERPAGSRRAFVALDDLAPLAQR